MKFTIWFDNNENTWNVNLDDDAMPEFEAETIQECLDWVKENSL